MPGPSYLKSIQDNFGRGAAFGALGSSMSAPDYVKWLPNNFFGRNDVQSTQPKGNFGALGSRMQLNAIPKNEPEKTVDTDHSAKNNSYGHGGIAGNIIGDWGSEWNKSFNDTFDDTDYYKNYGSLYDFQTKGTADEWRDFVNSDQAKRYYSDLGIVGDDAAFYDWFNKGRSTSLQDIYESQDSELLRYLGGDPDALMEINKAYVNSEDFANYADSIGIENADIASMTNKYNQVAAESYLKSKLDTPSQMTWSLDDLQKLFGDDYEFSDKLAEKTEGSSPMTKREAQSRRAMGELTLKGYDPLAKSFNDSYSGVDVTDDDIAHYAALLEQDTLDEGEIDELQALLSAENRPAFKAASLVRNYFPEFSYKAR